MKNHKNDYRVLLPEWNQADPYFNRFPGKLARTRQGVTPPWRVASDDKRRPVHEMSSTCDSLLNIYPNAIEIGTPMGAGGKAVFLILGTLIGLLGAAGIGYLAVLALLEIPLFGIFVSAAALLFLLFAVFCLRAALFSPRDLPVLFNRKDRSVSFIPYVTPSFWRFWEKGGAGAVRTRAWDDVKVRSYKWTQLTGAAARESYFLSLLWGDVDNPRSCAEIVNIGYTGWWEDAMLWRLYEHIRRYMEEDGPPIPHGEGLRRTGTGKLPAFPAAIIAAAGGETPTGEQVTGV
ncbi:hypothetical protein WS58_27455 [Burkholderia pseudomultivorans]|uniref:DUF6708 domain-containing protein n=1 Tax=Burkholderia pseudomultivorans TaxID=1207504 RepID=UPI00075AD7C2|nr:DUF6708 domain-containing protein [Burkholderia pseudomultivorans]KVC30697.1 hypothetical protein WS55_00630 [Burkholderia pseudomultivorans]KVC33943.1 hypothetical protein WS56_12955 [Burkholderia pseudomultivorans]KVC35350.1 hypothetical protein WS58_27455 [Burkholderia pseudomultivorans]